MTKVKSWDQTCPLCEANNQCAVAAGKAIESCWCRDLDISAEVLDAIPAEARNRVCICPACAAKQGESSAR